MSGPARLIVAGVAAAAVVALALAVRGDSDGGARPPEPRPDRDVAAASCSTAIRSRPVPRGPSDVVVGPAALRGIRTWSDEPRVNLRPKDGRPALAKVPVVLAPGATLELSVSAHRRGEVGLGYTAGTRAPARVAAADPAVRFEACFGDVPTGWPGAFVLDGPRCVSFVMRVGGELRPVRRTVAFGRGACR
jgi:hypothetical protein